MAEQEEDFSQLPLPDRFAHKNWKVRKEGYEAAVKEFNLAQSESDAVVRQFIQDPSLWKAAVADSNVAAQQEALSALCSFLQIAGTQGCTRTRNLTIVPIVEKGLSSTRPAAKQKALEAILLYIELDKPDPIIEELLPLLSHKQPKIIAATLSALTSTYHAYGCKTVEPKPVLKVLPKVFGHADKNVRGEAQNLTVEFYRWLKDAMKPLFWNDLKPVQQQDLEKLFEKVKDDPPPKQERLLRSQQAIEESSCGGGAGEVDQDVSDEEEAEIDLEPEYMAVDVMPKIPKDLHERLGSSKWKDRKDALDELQAAINHPKIEEGPFDEIMRALAKCMKDANIAVVSVAANCVELFAKGLKRSFAKYRSTVMAPMMERLKEKKQSVTDAIGAALDAVFASTSFAECFEEILEFLKHKNPQVKLESTRFLIRCLKTTREAPQPPEVKSIADAATKLLTESQEVQRSAGAEVLGTLWKIMGDRIMNPHLEGLDEIRKTKIKEYYETAEVKAKFKPKAAAPPPKPAATQTQKKALGKKPALTSSVKKPASAPASAARSAAASPTPPEELAIKPVSKPGVSKLGAPKSGLAPPGGRLGLQKKPGLAAPSASGVASPKRQPAPPEEPASAPIPKLGPLGAGRGLAGRPLGKPAPAFSEPVPVVPALSNLSAAERLELDELRAETERLTQQNADLKSEKQRLASQIHELQNQNATLIEQHTHDLLEITKIKNHSSRATEDAFAAQKTIAEQQARIDQLNRELARQVRTSSPPPYDIGERIYADNHGYANGTTTRHDRMGLGPRSKTDGYGASAGLELHHGEGKENIPDVHGMRKLSPAPGAGVGGGGVASSGRMSPSSRAGAERPGLNGDGDGARSHSGTSSAGSDAQPQYKSASEMTKSLRAKIEQMRRNQGLARP